MVTEVGLVDNLLSNAFASISDLLASLDANGSAVATGEAVNRLMCYSCCPSIM